MNEGKAKEIHECITEEDWNMSGFASLEDVDLPGAQINEQITPFANKSIKEIKTALFGEDKKLQLKENELLVANNVYRVIDELVKTNNRSVYHIEDDLKRKFLLDRRTFDSVKISIHNFVEILDKVSGKSGIIKVIAREISYKDQTLDILMEYGKAISSSGYPFPVLKRRIQNVLNMYMTIKTEGLRLSQITLSSFLETNRGLLLCDFDAILPARKHHQFRLPTILNRSKLQNSNFDPSDILGKIIAISKDNITDEEYAKCRELVCNTRIDNIDVILKDGFFFDSKKVTISPVVVKHRSFMTPQPRRVRLVVAKGPLPLIRSFEFSSSVGAFLILISSFIIRTFMSFKNMRVPWRIQWSIRLIWIGLMALSGFIFVCFKENLKVASKTSYYTKIICLSLGGFMFLVELDVFMIRYRSGYFSLMMFLLMALLIHWNLWYILVKKNR